VAEYLNEDDQVAALKKWWDDNGTALVVGLVVVIAGVIGWRAYSDYVQEQREGASAAYQRYIDLRQQNADADARSAAVAVLDGEYAGTTYQVFSLLHRATDAAKAGNFDSARDLLSQALANADDAHVADLVRVRLARVQRELGDAAASLATLQGVKGAGFRSYAAELKGDILLAEGKRDEALAAYEAAAAVEGADGSRTTLKLKIADLTSAGAADAP